VKAPRLLLAALLLVTGCVKQTLPVETGGGGCVNVTGQYAGVFQDSCGRKTTTDVTLFQVDGCTVYAEIPAVGTLRGTVQGAVVVFAIGFSPCTGSASGSAQVSSGGGLTGTYSGQAAGAGCCGPVTGSFTLTRK
jgi:hypothetical protein